MPSPEINKNVISGEEFTEPYRQSDELLTRFDITVAQNPFIIDRADYMVLRSNKNASLFTSISIEIGAAGIGIGISMLIRYLVALHNRIDPGIQSWEPKTFVAFLIVAVILFYIGNLMPSEKKTLLKKMSSHFEASPRTVESRRIR